MSEGETGAKNRIEFQWGSKLQGTSSEALVPTDLGFSYFYTQYFKLSDLEKTYLQNSKEPFSISTGGGGGYT